MHESPPLAYVIHHHQQRCLHCGRSHDYCAIYARNDVKPVTITGLGRAVSNLHTIKQPSDVNWNVPIEHAEARIVEIPFCHACYSTVSLAHNLTPPRPQVATGAAAKTYDAAATVSGGYAVESTSPFHKVAPKPRREPIKAATIDDLLA
jgi:hypothetical protein